MCRCALLVTAALAVVAPAAARADCCMGPPVVVWVPENTPLTPVLHAEVTNDDLERPADGRVRVFLNVAGRRIADLGTFDVHASIPAAALAIPVPAAARSAARAAGRRAHEHRAVLKFLVQPVVTPSDPAPRAYGLDSFLSLDRPVPTHGRLRLPLGSTSIIGAGGRLSASVRLTVPRTWRRTTPRDAERATIEPLTVGDCRVTIEALPTAVATRDVDRFLDGDGIVPRPRGTTGGTGTRRWRVSVPRPGIPGDAVATGLQRIARHRWAGARVIAHFAPGCDGVPRHPYVVALRRAVRDIRVTG